jgi:hypothetical protein
MLASSSAVFPLPGPPRMTTLPGGSMAASSAGGPSGRATGPAPGSAPVTVPAGAGAATAWSADRPPGGWFEVGTLGRFMLRAS